MVAYSKEQIPIFSPSLSPTTTAVTPVTSSSVNVPSASHGRRRPSWRRPLILATFGAAVVIGVPAGAQTPGPFDNGLSLTGSWLQANALPLDRDALQSGSVAVGLRHNKWNAEVGALRIARTLSTVEGATVSIGRVLRWKAVEIIPNVGILGGKAYASADTTGFDWVATGGVTGHTPRYSYSEAATFGGGAGLTIEIPVFSIIAVRGTASEWYFSGAPLESDRARTLLGAGLSLRVGR
jgi:hypothetical protein